MGSGNLGSLLVEQGKAWGMKKGIADRGNADWPSAVLHEIGSSMDGGIDKRRLAAMADFIEGLVMVPDRGEPAPGPLGTAAGVDGRYPCLGYVLRPGGEGFGTVCFHPHEPNEERRRDPQGYYLTGFGLCCWARGKANGINAVATVEASSQLQDVFIAEPIRQGNVPGFTLGDVTPRHVADAIRQFIDCEDATRAWFMASGLKVGAVEEEEAEPEPPASEPPKLVLARAATLTLGDSWKGLLVADRFDELSALCDRRVGELESERDRLEAERDRIEEERSRVRADLAKWRKRQKAAAALASVDDDDGTD